MTRPGESTARDRVREAPPRVAHVVLSLDPGGLERVVVDLVREGAALGQSVEVVCVQRPGALAGRAEAMGGRVRCIAKRPGEWAPALRRMRAAWREIGPDVVHTHQVGALLYAGPAARLEGVPVVVHTEHGQYYPGRVRARLVGRLTGRFAARFFGVSRDVAELVVAHRIVPRRKVHVVPNGIDTRRFAAGEDRARLRLSLGLPAGAPLVGTVGRLSEVKRQDVLIRAFARVRARFPGAVLVLVGEGPERAALERLVGGLGLADRVRFAGYQAEPQHYLRALDVFALTSRSEGMPLVVLEAWAAGVPVVASRVGGLPELIAEGRTGHLFEPGDEPALAGAIAGLLADPARRAAIRDAALDRVRSQFDVRAMARDYDRHYRELLAPRGASR